jgi:cold shock CspA family protein
MLYGTIRTLHRDRGFGFIEQPGGRDVYFHAAAVADNAFERLLPEQPVKFELAKLTEEERERQRELKEKKGPRASLVQLIDRMPGGILPARTPQELAPRHHPRARQRKATWKRRIDVAAKRKEAG